MHSSKLIKKIPFTIIFCCLLIFIHLLLKTNFLDQSLFAIKAEQNIYQIYAYHVSSPLRFFGLTLLSSSLIHLSDIHLVVNLVFLLIFVTQLRGFFSEAKIYILLIGIHITSLLLSSLFFLNFENNYLTGLSAALLGLFGMINFQKEKKVIGIIVFFLLVLFYFQATKEQKVASFCHLMGYLSGLVCYLLLNFKRAKIPLHIDR